VAAEALKAGGQLALAHHDWEVVTAEAPLLDSSLPDEEALLDCWLSDEEEPLLDSSLPDEEAPLDASEAADSPLPAEAACSASAFFAAAAFFALSALAAEVRATTEVDVASFAARAGSCPDASCT
jgi:hypothetical protein